MFIRIVHPSLRPVLLVLALALLFEARSQQMTYYTTANTSTELIENRVYNIQQSTDGSIWFGTEKGVSILKNNIWKNYLSADTLLGRVGRFAIDKKGATWFANSLGIVKWDGNKWTVYNEKNAPFYLRNGATSVAVDKAGNKWFGTSYNGVIKYNDTTWTQYINMANGSNIINCIAVDSNNHIWVGGEKGLGGFNGQYWTSYRSLQQYDTGDIDVLSIAIDKNNTKYLGTTYTIYTQEEGDYGFRYAAITGGVQQGQDNIVAFDPQGNLWIGSSAGIRKYDGTLAGPRYTLDSDIPDVRILSISFDASGNTWVGTEDGALKFNGSSWTVYRMNGLYSNSIQSMAIDAQGNKWFGASNGSVTKFDGTKWRSFDRRNSIVKGNIISITSDAQGNKWFGSSANGLYKYNDKTWTNYSTIGVYSLSSVQALTADFQQNLWVGTSSRLVKYDGTNWDFLVSGLTNANIRSIALEGTKTKWFGTDNCLGRFDGTSWTNYQVKDGMIQPIVHAIAVDAEGNKWLGTHEAISKFDGRTWTHYTNPKVFANRSVLAIAIDADGNKWIINQDSLVKFDGAGFHKYPFWANNFIQIDPEGGKWCMTVKGLTVLRDGGAGPVDPSKVQKGLVYHDMNGNGLREPNEPALFNQIIKVDDKFLTTQQVTGLFYSPLANGAHTFYYRAPAHWELTTDSSQTVTVSNTPLNDTLLFGARPLQGIHDLQLGIAGTAARVGFQSHYWLTYANTGTETESGSLSFNMDPNAFFVNASLPPDSVIGNRVVWKFEHLAPNERRQVSIIAQMPGVPFLGDTLVSVSEMHCPQTSTRYILKQCLTGSYDPNDKQVLQGLGSKGYVVFGQELEYTIRFQNTGTDTAFHVSIRDSLSPHLDPQTLEVVGSSHPLVMELRGQNEVTFQFPHILLPDSNTNKIESNGFVTFKVKPKPHLTENTMVENTARIYFDFNPPIVTNQTKNTYVSQTTPLITNIVASSPKWTAKCYPNPAKGQLNIVLPNSEGYTLSFCNMMGRVLQKSDIVEGNKFQLPLEDFPPGMYLYVIENKRGEKSTGKVILEE